MQPLEYLYVKNSFAATNVFDQVPVANFGGTSRTLAKNLVTATALPNSTPILQTGVILVNVQGKCAIEMRNSPRN